MKNRINVAAALMTLLFTQHALAAANGKTCSDLDIKTKPCFVVEGNLHTMQGWPPFLRLESSDHKHIYGFDYDASTPINTLPKAIQEMLATNEGQMDGKFEVCPLGQTTHVPYDDRPIEMACLGSGRKPSSLPPISLYYQEGHGPKPEPLIPAARKVADAYAKMMNHPGDSLYEVQYLLAFPHDYQTFEKVYDSKMGSQLHDKMIYQVYLAMKKLGKKHPQLVGIDLMTLGKQADYSSQDFSDNTEMLEQTIMGYAVANTRLFVQLFNQLSEVEKKKLEFLISSIEYTDFQNDDSQFKTLIKNLESSGANDIAGQLQQQFKQAKIDWEKQTH